MKKLAALVIATLLLAVLLLTGCSGGSGDDVIEIGERHFVNQVDEIFLNSSQYLGRTIRYAGMFRTFNWPATGEEFYFVIRYTFGCCGEEPIGFELNPDGLDLLPNGTWVEITGVLERYEDAEFSSLLLRVVSMVELDEPGAEFV